MARASELLASALRTLVLLLLTAAQPPPAPADRERRRRPGAALGGLARSAPRGDPAIAEVQDAAARWADPRSRRARGRSRARARVAALLPRLTAEFRFDERSYRVVGLQGAGEVDYARHAPGWRAACARLGTSASSSPPRGRAATPRRRRDRARRRDEAVRRATALYFERRRLRLALVLEPPAVAARAGRGRARRSSGWPRSSTRSRAAPSPGARR